MRASLMYFGLIVPAYSYAFFAPGIIKTYGYSQIGYVSPPYRSITKLTCHHRTQLHSVPPWAAAWGFSMIVAYFSDLFKHRFLFVLIPTAIAIAGFAILITTHDNHHLEYGALFMVTSGVYAAMPVIVCWFTMNLGGHHRRAVGTAWQIGFGNIGGIIATYSFLAKDAPKYTQGYGICLGFICLSLLSCVAYFVAIVVQNRNRDKTPDVGLTEYEKTELGDMSSDYRYQL